jgi:hypothetical protein
MTTFHSLIHSRAAYPRGGPQVFPGHLSQEEWDDWKNVQILSLMTLRHMLCQLINLACGSGDRFDPTAVTDGETNDLRAQLKDRIIKPRNFITHEQATSNNTYMGEYMMV